MPPRAKAEAPPRPPSTPSRPALPREFVASYKRRRIMDAFAELIAEQGYEATKIAEIVRRAGVARKTLYDNFEGKEEVFLAAFDAALEEAMQRVEGSCAAAEDGWEERIQAGLAAFLGYVAEEPALARMCMIEARSATKATTKRHEDAERQFVELTKRSAPRKDDLRATTDDATIGGAAWIIHRKIRAGEAEKALDLLPELSEFVLGPYRGDE